MNKEHYQQALLKIRPHITNTPLITNDSINRLVGARVFFKCENLQVTGSFKIRGCFNKLIGASKEPRITRSSGNFAQALAWAGKLLEIETTVIMPNTAPLVKQQRAQLLGAQLLLSGPTHAEGYTLLEKTRLEIGATPIASFDDPEIIIGQGTIILEMIDEIANIRHLITPLGGGGLSAGCSHAMKLYHPNAETIVIEPTAAADYHHSRQKGVLSYLQSQETIADGLRSPSVGQYNWPLLQKYVDRNLTVNDETIIKAMQILHQNLNMVIEPSGAISFAALLTNAWRPKGDVLCILSGGNVDQDKFQKWITPVV